MHASAGHVSAHAMPFGAELRADGTCFRLWAPALARATLRLETAHGAPREVAMAPRGEGWFEVAVDGARAGTRYRFDVGRGLHVPDPASRFQPQDCHGPSEVVDPRAYAWQCAAWAGRPWHEAVLYELHVGTFTPAGTFRAAAERLDALADLGVTMLEILPVADFPGRRNWGYDGVLPFSPDSTYGRPDDFKALIDAAHARGLAVLLDVVYNHFGPDGNYLHAYAPDFFTDRHSTPWGTAINFDGQGRGQQSRWVREFFLSNALYWLEEYRLDGLRLDAVHAIHDDSRPDVIEELAARVAAGPGRDRPVHLVLENDRNEPRYLRATGGRARCTAQWNDDFHHACHVLATGETSGYYASYADDPLGMLARCLTAGFAYQGEVFPFSGEPRGAPTDGVPATAFVGFLQNHDQVGNRAFGERIAALAEPRHLALVGAIHLLQPGPPLLWMGEEWAASTPFQYFCDFPPELAERVRDGRRAEFGRFAEFADPVLRDRIPDPGAPATFARSKLDWAERRREPHSRVLARYAELLRLRAEHVVPRLASGVVRAECARPSAHELRVDWTFGDGGTATLLVNLDERPATFETPPGRRIWPASPGELQAVVPPVSAQWYVQAPA